MTEHLPPPAWTQTGWSESAESWIRAQLEARGAPASGPVETLHRRPWAVVMRAPIAGGQVYFKAGAPHLSNEAALMQTLYRWRPDCMVETLAIDPERRWSLMADEGQRLRDHLGGSRQTLEAQRIWERLLPLFAELQIQMIQRAPELLALGLVDQRVERLPGMFAGLLADAEALRLGRDDGLSLDQHARLLDSRPRYAGWCARLVEFPIPNSLHHDDFHDGNILTRGERCTFSDWGDSCLTHPFFSIIITLRSISDRLGMPDEATESPDRLPPELERLRDAYLEPWTGFAPAAALREIFPTAWRVGMVNRALDWQREIHQMDPAGREEYGYTVPAWLGEFLLAG